MMAGTMAGRLADGGAGVLGELDELNGAQFFGDSGVGRAGVVGEGVCVNHRATVSTETKNMAEVG